MDVGTEKLVRPTILKVFKDKLQNMGVTNYSLKILQGTKKGQNLLGIIAEVEVDSYNSEENCVKQHFVIKSAPDNKLYRLAFFIEEMYFREIYVYSELLPKFANIQEEKNILNSFNSYPTYYTSCRKYGQEAIILENLKANGYKHWNRAEPADLSHVSLVARELGRFHALSYAIRDQKPEVFKNIVDNTQEVFFQNFKKIAKRTMTLHRINEVMKIINPVNNKEVYEKYKQFADNWLETLSNCIDSKSADQYAVVNHGDCSISNVLFKYNDLANPCLPTQLCFFDWQMSRIGSPVLDLTSFIFSCTDKEFRDKHYNEIIHEYYNSLASLLKELGTDVDKLIPFKVLEEQLKKYSIYGLYIAMMLIFGQFTEEEDVQNFHNTIPEDTDTWLIYNISKIDKFNLRIKDVIFDFDKLGYNFVNINK